MTASDDFLVEIGTEELPPKSLLTLSKVFCREIEKELATYELTHGSVVAYATPRRLAVTVAELSLKQQDQSVSRRGPAVAAAFDNEGKPTKAAEVPSAAAGEGESESKTPELPETLPSKKHNWKNEVNTFKY